MKINPKLLLDSIYPIGSIYINTTGTNPSTFLGGTWESFGNGRVLVGQDTNDTDFDTLLETGGSKKLQEHTHNITANVYANVGAYGYAGINTIMTNDNNLAQRTGTTSAAGTGNSGNLQPYIVVSIWKRTA